MASSTHVVAKSWAIEAHLVSTTRAWAAWFSVTIRVLGSPGFSGSSTFGFDGG